MRRLPVPVIVVGNITVGGTGKTPLVLWLASYLRARGYRPASSAAATAATHTAPSRVTPDADPRAVGDEPVLLARRSGCPVWTGADRAAAAARSARSGIPRATCWSATTACSTTRLGRDVEIA